MCVCVGGGGKEGRLTPSREAVLVYIQDDRGWVHIPSRSPVFADSQDVCVCVCWGRGEGGQAYTQESSCVGL